MKARHLIMGLLLLATPYRASAQTTHPNPVIHWTNIVQQSIHNAAAPRSAGSSEILHTVVHLAVYDAVVAIEGDAQPFAAQIKRSPSADVKAAVATAAFLTARGRVPAAQHAMLQAEYDRYMLEIPNTWAKSDGVRIGFAAATKMLQVRASDNFNNVASYFCSGPLPLPIYEWEPESGCPTSPSSPQPVDMKLGKIKPFTNFNVTLFRPGPPTTSTETYATDFDETRDYGRDTSSVRSDEQTDVAFFWSENPYVHWNRNLARLAVESNLSTSETARLFAMVHTSVSDAIIVGFEAKYYYRFWRPRTAIPLANFDDNPDTVADPSWKPLLLVNHPEYPSGHGFWSGALLYAVQSFFQTEEVNWTLETSKAAVPRLVKTQRAYTSLYDLEAEIQNARVWGGLHWRESINVGELIGDGIALHVLAHNFRRIP